MPRYTRPMSAPFAPLYTVDQIRAIELAANQADPDARLMERAGAAAAKLAVEMLGAKGKNILILAGPGNNGGDALEVALHLKRGFFNVDVVFTDDPGKLPIDATKALNKWRAGGGEILADIPSRKSWDLIVDGLFGIGLARPVSGRHAALIAAANGMGVPILALDIPSGINGTAIRATRTITFIAHKPGLLTLDGPDHCGALHCDPLGLAVESLLHPEGRIIDAGILASGPGPRRRNFHKGDAGSVAIIGGATGMTGAALLAARAALKTGAGKVFLALLADPPLWVDMHHPEIMIRRAEQLLSSGQFNALVAGPGLGTDAAAQRVLTQVLRTNVPVVLDADALNLIGAYSTLANTLVTRTVPTLITPHPAEAARMLNSTVAAIQSDRVAAARLLARRFKVDALLKGNGSVLAVPDSRWWIVPAGNPGMASGGMGDVLAGVLGALLAQGVPTPQALQLGVYLHAAAADHCVAEGEGPIGLTASEVIDRVRALINRHPT
jgi:ADP-dependent NAD(P)H-hydrate dehydratase / NAD(P)H-hydrate epimerase